MVDKINAFAKSRGVAPAQLALAWIRAHSITGVCGTIIPIPGAVVAKRVNENCTAVEISGEEKGELDAILESFEVIGHRQIPEAEQSVWTYFWGVCEAQSLSTNTNIGSVTAWAAV